MEVGPAVALERRLGTAGLPVGVLRGVVDLRKVPRAGLAEDVADAVLLTLPLRGRPKSPGDSRSISLSTPSLL